MKGPVHTNLMLEFQPKARIENDIYYRALAMHQGAVVCYQLLLTGAADTKPLLKLPANNQ